MTLRLDRRGPGGACLPPSRTLRGDRCLCRACGQYFNSTAAFDKHRTGKYRQFTDLGPETRRCRTVEEMLQCGMSKNSADYWITSKMHPDASATLSGATISTKRYPPQGST